LIQIITQYNTVNDFKFYANCVNQITSSLVLEQPSLLSSASSFYP
jgi:hypothetical protein